MAIKIICRPNGPYLVENDGSIELYDAIGTKVDLTGKAKFALCRCGGSPTKPVCDGTHSKNRVPAAGAAVRPHENPLPSPEGLLVCGNTPSPRTGRPAPASCSTGTN